MSSSSRAERAFAAYVELGPDRSLARLASVLRATPQRYGMRRAPSLRTLEAWSSRHGWQGRLDDIEHRAREAAEREHLEWVNQHRARLRQEGLLLQQRGIAWLTTKEPPDVSAHEAIRAIETGFRLEALALGEATERIAVEETDERLHRLSDEELEQLIRVARQVDPGGAPGAGEPAS